MNNDVFVYNLLNILFVVVCDARCHSNVYSNQSFTKSHATTVEMTFVNSATETRKVYTLRRPKVAYYKYDG